MKKRRSIGIGMLFLVLVMVMTIKVVAGDFPVTVVDDLGARVTLEKKPDRIISLAPNLTELLFALKLNEEIVGVTSFADYPEEALYKTKIGTILEPNIEKIITMKPDIVFAAGINKMEIIEKLKNLGIKVVGFNPQTINDVFLVIKKAGQLTGKNDRARELVTDMYIELSQIQDMVDKVLENRSRPKVFYEIWSDPLYTAGDNTFIDDVIKIAGGINIGANARGSWPQYSIEKLLLENPDIYISSPHSAPYKVTVESIKERENYQNIKAIKNNRVYIIDQNIISRPSPRIIEGLKKFVKAIFPELTEKVEGLNK